MTATTTAARDTGRTMISRLAASRSATACRGWRTSFPALHDGANNDVDSVVAVFAGVLDGLCRPSPAAIEQHFCGRNLHLWLDIFAVDVAAERSDAGVGVAASQRFQV